MENEYGQVILLLVALFILVFILSLIFGINSQNEKNNQALRQAIYTTDKKVREYSSRIIKFSDYYVFDKNPENLRILTNNAFIQSGVLYPNTYAEENDFIIVQDTITSQVFIFMLEENTSQNSMNFYRILDLEV